MTDVTVLGPHSLDGWSMKRYAEVLAAGYRGAGLNVTTLVPTEILSSRIRRRTFRKLVAYIESMILFPLATIGAARRSTIHLADHSHAHLLLWPWLRKSAVVTCHDLFAVRAARGEIPEHKTRPTGVIYQRLVLAGLRRASEVICVSATTKSDVVRLIDHVPARVVSNPLTAPFTTRVTPESSDEFALVVSSSGWRKRREYAISLWRGMRRSDTSRDLRLVIVGPALSESEILSAGEDAPFITVESGLSNDRLRQKYADASFLIQASRYEGFGWPVIEANSQGTVAICADHAIFREIGPWNVFVSEDGPIDWNRLSTQVRESDPDELVRLAREYSLERFSAELSVRFR